ncbi:hypothetical protein Hanom_Chr07g00617321 [Helianthus anomalus]
MNSGLYAANGPVGLVIIRQFYARCDVCEQSTLLFAGLLELRMNDGYDRFLCLLCFNDPAVHLVLLSLGGLQCLFYLVYDAFMYNWVRSNGWLIGFYCVYLT